MPFATQPSPLSPTFQGPSALGGSLGGVSVPVTQDLNHLIFDPSNPALFNFNLDGLNFRNTYGGVEMAMLNHMSAGAAETPPGPGEMGGFGTNHGFVNGNGGNNSGGGGSGLEQFAGQPAGIDRALLENLIGLENLYPNGSGNLSHGLPFAVAIQSMHSPSTDNSPQPTTNLGFDRSPSTGGFGNTTPVQRPANKPPSASAAGPFRQSILGKRARDPSSVYETVKEPYPYVKGFHNMITSLRRFEPNNIQAIVKALASIRPSFIAATRTFNRQDLIFMEKCFQRTLFEYEDFMHHCSAPTIVCRRTGEVAAVNKEFTALTGWTKEVLLGKEPNFNANFSGSNSSSGPTISTIGSGRAGLTPMLSSTKPDLGQSDRPQPIFIAELLDEESVTDVYKDFAELAFENSRGHVTRKCKLVKYRTKDSMDSAASNASTTEEGPKELRPGPILSSRVTRIDHEHAVSRLEKDGKVDCMYTWTIKRDVFDIPMMIVMNVSINNGMHSFLQTPILTLHRQFLPCYYRNQEPHHLPV